MSARTSALSFFAITIFDFLKVRVDELRVPGRSVFQDELSFFSLHFFFCPVKDDRELQVGE
jgi:hypothetical protein